MGKDKSKKCTGDDCSEPTHLCKIAKAGDADWIRSIVKDPTHLCKKCLRTANRPENLCKPESL